MYCTGLFRLATSQVLMVPKRALRVMELQGKKFNLFCLWGFEFTLHIVGAKLEDAWKKALRNYREILRWAVYCINSSQ